MTIPTIQDAKALAQKHRALGVLILSFANGQYAFASYGHTRRTCDAMRRLVAQLDDMIQTRDIEIPAELGEVRDGIAATDDVTSHLLIACESALTYIQADVETEVSEEREGMACKLHDALLAAIAKAKGTRA